MTKEQLDAIIDDLNEGQMPHSATIREMVRALRLNMGNSQ